MIRSLYNGKYDDILEFGLDLTDFDLATFLKWLDGILDYNYFGNSSIETLDAIKNSMCNYDLPCKVTLPTSKIPFFEENQRRGISCDFRVKMNLYDNSIGGNKQVKEKIVMENEEYDFNFSDLNLNTSYSFEAQLEIEYKISDKAYWLSIGMDPDKIGPITHKYSKFGEKNHFT